MSTPMSANDAWAHTPRQYRPHGYLPHLPHSVSMSSIVEEPCPPVPDTSYRRITTSTTYNSRRTDTNFALPAPRPVFATVAPSRLTASVSANDISQPSARYPRQRLAEIQNTLPSIIPTPILSKSPQARRNVSTPVLPSQKYPKENVPPKARRLLGPISPTRNNVVRIPKSRTMGMLSSLTASFSRSNLNLSLTSSRQNSGTSTSEEISIASSSSPPQPIIVSHTRQVYTAQENSYWCGRFQALNDRLHNESLTESIKDENVLRQFIAEPPSTPKQKATFKAILMAKGKSSNIATEVTEGLDTCTGFLTEDNNQRMKRAFVHLEAYCMTPDAKKSLWEWQLRYARLEQNEKLLPVGGKMSENGSWVRRMGKAFAGSKFSGSSENAASIGSKTSTGLGRKEGSVMSLMNELSKKGSEKGKQKAQSDGL